MGKKEIILENATQIFLKFGLHKISMDELADQIGVSKKTIYNYFGSKENLLEAIIHDKMEKLLESLSDILLDENITIIEKINLGVKAICTDYATFERAVSQDPNAARISRMPECALLNDKIQNAVEVVAKEAQDQGLIKQGIHLQMLPYVFLNIVRGLSSWTTPDNYSFSKLDLMKHSIDIVMDGLLTEKGLEEFYKS